MYLHKNEESSAELISSGQADSSASPGEVRPPLKLNSEDADAFCMCFRLGEVQRGFLSQNIVPQVTWQIFCMIN